MPPPHTCFLIFRAVDSPSGLRQVGYSGITRWQNRRIKWRLMTSYYCGLKPKIASSGRRNPCHSTFCMRTSMSLCSISRPGWWSTLRQVTRRAHWSMVCWLMPRKCLGCLEAVLCIDSTRTPRGSCWLPDLPSRISLWWHSWRIDR